MFNGPELSFTKDILKQESKHKFVLFSHKGKVLGVHPTEKAAKAQESAINISKARKAGHNIPRATPPRVEKKEKR